MTKSFIGSGAIANGSTQNGQNTSWFCSCGTSWCSFATTTEDAAKVKWGDTGVHSRISCNVITNARGNATTIALRKNGANGACAISVGSGATGVFFDGVDSDNSTAGDFINYVQTTGAGFANFRVNTITHVFDGTGSYGAPITTIVPTAQGDVGTNYFAIGDATTSTVTESNTVVRLKACTLSFLSMYISSNSAAVVTFRTRVNQANANQSVSTPSNGAGYFVDTIDTDTVTNNQTLSFQGSASGGGVYNYISTGTWAEIAGGSSQTLVSSPNGSMVQVNANDNFINPIGEGQSLTATEANAQIISTAAFTWSNIRVDVTGTVNQVSTYKSRIGGLNGNQTISIPASTGGFFEDTLDTDSLVAGSLFCTDWFCNGASVSGSLQQLSSQLNAFSGLPSGTQLQALFEMPWRKLGANQVYLFAHHQFAQLLLAQPIGSFPIFDLRRPIDYRGARHTTLIGSPPVIVTPKSKRFLWVST